MAEPTGIPTSPGPRLGAGVGGIVMDNPEKVRHEGTGPALTHGAHEPTALLPGVDPFTVRITGTKVWTTAIVAGSAKEAERKAERTTQRWQAESKTLVFKAETDTSADTRREEEVDVADRLPEPANIEQFTAADGPHVAPANARAPDNKPGEEAFWTNNTDRPIFDSHGNGVKIGEAETPAPCVPEIAKIPHKIAEFYR